MKKKTILNVADTVFWYLLYFFPVIAYLLFLIAEPSSGTTIVALNNFFSTIGINFATDNIIVDVLSSLFGSSGILPFFADNSAFYFFSWFASCVIIHLAIDFIIFIPRLAHKWMNYFTRTDC